MKARVISIQGNAVPSEPMMFLKPTTSYIVEGEKIKIPKGCTELHHEVELGEVLSVRAEWEKSW